jgi:hypothetical protein
MAKPEFNVEAYQRRIDEIIPPNREGKSVIRLAWAPAVEETVFGKRLPRYWFTRTGSEDNWTYEQPQRWVLERRIERSAYYEAHQAGRYFTNDHGETVDFGEPPEEYYVTFYKIAVHDTFKVPVKGEPWAREPMCCSKKYEEDGQVCWGLDGEAGYRVPDERDLQMVAAAVRKMESEPFYDPYQPMSQEQLLAVTLQATHDTERVAEEKATATREAKAEWDHVTHNVRTVARSFSTDMAAARKRYRDLTGGFTRQGNVYVPDNN